MIRIGVLLGVLLVFPTVGSVSAQGRLRSIRASAILAMPWLTRIDLTKIKYTPWLKFGYQRMGMHLTTPIPFRVYVKKDQTMYKRDSVELKLPDVNLWVGEAGIAVRVVPTVSLHVSCAGNLLQNLFLYLSGSRGGADATTWRTHTLTWMEIEGGIRYHHWNYFSVVSGVRWDHFDLTIKDPDVMTKVDVGAYRNLNLLTSDILSRFWIPYIGGVLQYKDLKVTVIGTPFAPAVLRVRTRLRADIPPSDNFLGETSIKMKSSAMFVEAKLEFKIHLAERAKLNLWGKGGCLEARGGGRLESGYSTNNSGLKVDIGNDRALKFTRYTLGGGMELNMTF